MTIPRPERLNMRLVANPNFHNAAQQLDEASQSEHQREPGNFDMNRVALAQVEATLANARALEEIKAVLTQFLPGNLPPVQAELSDADRELINRLTPMPGGPITPVDEFNWQQRGKPEDAVIPHTKSSRGLADPDPVPDPVNKRALYDWPDVIKEMRSHRARIAHRLKKYADNWPVGSIQREVYASAAKIAETVV